MTPSAVVIGAGFAGLRAAVALADAGVRVTVLESRAGLGGRARSFTDPATGEIVDNGQHLFLSGYDRTREFLRRLGTEPRLIFQDRFQVSFVEPGGRRALFHCPAAPAPWHLLLGLLRFPGLTWPEKRALLRLPGELSRNGQVLDETVEQWLTRLGQGSRSRRSFWDPLAVAALNEDPSKASAIGLRSVLRRMMMRPWSEGRLGMACVGLSQLYAEQAARVVEEQGGQVLRNRPATGLETEGTQVRAVRLADGASLPADAVVSAVGPSQLLRLLSDGPACLEPLRKALSGFSYSPIVSVNLWFDSPWMEGEPLFTALVGARFQWVFNKQAILARAGVRANYVSLIVSAAHDLLDRPNEEMAQLALGDLGRCFPKARCAGCVRSQVVREREATVSPGVGMESTRPGPRTPLDNLFLAGDWTATGLPATIESAVLSGETAALALRSTL